MPARLARLPSPACHRPKIVRSHGNLPAIATHAGIEPAPCTWRWQAGGGQVAGQAPGVLHHVIIRGIERRKIFLNYLFKKPSKDSS